MLADFCLIRLQWWMVLLCLLAGCKTAADNGPLYKLQALEERALATPVAVSVTDKRPPNERKYVAGAVVPVDYQQGIEMLTLDNFDPQLTDLLKQSFAQRLSTLTPAPTWADVEITSFRVVVDRREILAAEYDQQLATEELAPVAGLGAGMVEGSVAGMVSGVGAGLMTAAVAANKRKEVENHRTSWNHAIPSVTCEITVHVALHWPNDRQEVFDLKAESHSMAPGAGAIDDVLNELKWSVSPTVDQTIRQISDRLLLRAGDSVRNNPGLREAAEKPAGGAPPRFNPAKEIGPELEGAEPLPPPLESK